jgi:hypothetical protein
MTSKEEAAVDILTRIQDLRRVCVLLERISEPCQKLMGDWMAGGPRPEPSELQTASMVIQSVGYIRIYCREVEGNLTKMLDKMGFVKVSDPSQNSPP